MRRARELRREMSLPEVLLWAQLRQRPGGHKFRKQVPFHPYTLDFACLQARLAIEVDGEVHSRGDQPQHDVRRDAVLAAAGFTTLRLPAADVLKNLDGCLTTIVAMCGADRPPPPRLRRGPPPRAGEE